MSNQSLPLTDRIEKKNIDEVFFKEFGQEYLDYRENWKKSGKDYIPDFPVNLDIECADDCNYRCNFCYRNANSKITEDINTGVRFNMDLYEKILKEGQENNLKAINFGFSGEPLINPNLAEMVKMARKYGIIDVRIISNGGLLTQEKIEKLLIAGVTFFSLSIDAINEETYFKVKGSKLFYKVIENLKFLYETREKMGKSLPVIRASFYSNPENKGQEEQFIKMVSPFTDFVDIQAFSDIKDKSRKLKRVYDCDMPFRRMGIFANGKVCPCCSFYSKLLIVGDANKNTIKEIWNSQAVKGVRDSFINQKPNEVCLRCLSAVC
ncbi:MAG: radical SAM/SPASM domain-containing protein [Candidatus Pacebacteria bacterium]|nr:radical SAM/SPASM domain-containing protein [Candidatus Paceibacterota bacterium]